MISPSSEARVSKSAAPSWAASAFVIEAIVLLAFLIASSAVFVQLFSASLVRSQESGATAAAVAAATTVAERFAADPANAQGVTQVGDLVVTCETDSEKRVRGTLYHAHISVYQGADAPTDGTAVEEHASGDRAAVYAVSTAAYVSEASS